MSLREDMAKLANQVQVLTAKVEAANRPEPDKTDKQIREEARDKRHEENVAAYKERNHRPGQKPHNYTNDDRAAAQTSKMKSETPPLLDQKPKNTARPQALVYSSESHPWKVTPARNALGEEIPSTVKVLGGDFSSQETGTTTPVGGDDGLDVADQDYVYLKVTRNPDRTVSDLVIESGGGIPTSTKDNQYFPIARVSVDGNTGRITGILTLQFEEISIFEDMFVSNGEFKLASISIKGRNTYLPP